jgi:hypothetical protein
MIIIRRRREGRLSFDVYIYTVLQHAECVVPGVPASLLCILKHTNEHSNKRERAE